MSNPALAGLLLAALVLRALIPVGFMPVFAAGAAVQIQLCSSSGFESRSQDHPGHGTSTHGTPCLYSVSGTLAPPPCGGALISANAAIHAPSPRAVSAVFIPSIIRTQSPRGPPTAV